jgi:hypothetical protein
MTPSFFQSLEEHHVSYLLISGQATVLDEAADFSEDVDIWINPSADNIQRFTASLRALKAQYYKLTPPLTEARMRAGHGFHFTIQTEKTFYLDVLGQPPRVGAFDDALSTSETFELTWGRIPVIGIRELVEVKKTQRLRHNRSTGYSQSGPTWI